MFFEYGSLLNGQHISKKGVEVVANFLMFIIIIMTNVVVYMHSVNYDPLQQSKLAQVASVIIVLQWS